LCTIEMEKTNMSSLKKTAGNLLLLLVLLSLAACSTPATPAPAAPTQDLTLLRTEVAATVLAQVPQYCALTPTATLPPTATSIPTATATVAPTGTVEVQGTAGTPGTPSGSIPDRARYVSQTVVDGTRFAPNVTFNMTWRLQNTGTTTWTTNYSFRFWGGDQLGAPRIVQLERDVPPGDSIDITVPMRTPTRTGEFRSRWVMANAAQASFKEDVYLQITVVAPAALTATATATVPAPTATSTATKAP
jgi:hypothetical protein